MRTLLVYAQSVHTLLSAVKLFWFLAATFYNHRHIELFIRHRQRSQVSGAMTRVGRTLLSVAFDFGFFGRGCSGFENQGQRRRTGVSVPHEQLDAQPYARQEV
jgi:hypothetical protein